MVQMGAGRGSAVGREGASGVGRGVGREAGVGKEAGRGGGTAFGRGGRLGAAGSPLGEDEVAKGTGRLQGASAALQVTETEKERGRS